MEMTHEFVLFPPAMRIFALLKPYLPTNPRLRIMAIMAVLIFAVLLALGLAKSVWHSRMIAHRIAHEEKHPAAPAGIDGADFSSKDIELSGWAPTDANIRVSEHGKKLSEDTADKTGAWDLPFAPEGRKPFHLFDIEWQRGQTPASMGQLMFFITGSDDAYIWLQATATGAPQILLTPDAGEKADLSLTLMQYRDKQSLQAAGSAAPHSIVQLYADGDLAGVATADDTGRWIMMPVIDSSKKSPGLRLDEIYKGSVRERRSYKLPWPEKDTGGDQPAVLQTNSDSWIVSAPGEDGHRLIAIFKPDAGSSMSPGKLIPGQVMPVTEGKK